MIHRLQKAAPAAAESCWSDGQLLYPLHLQRLQKAVWQQDRPYVALQKTFKPHAGGIRD